MKKTGKRIIGIVVLLLIVVLLQGSMVSTYNDEYKLILQFGKVVRVVETPGLSFKIPFLQTTQSIPNYEMIYDLIPSEVNTRDKKVMVTDSFALWSVTDPLAYLSRLGANKANAESRISVVVYNVRCIMAFFNIIHNIVKCIVNTFAFINIKTICRFTAVYMSPEAYFFRNTCAYTCICLT